MLLDDKNQEVYKQGTTSGIYYDRAFSAKTYAMKAYAFLLLAALSSISSASPLPNPQSGSMEACDVSSSQFYLVTASSPLCNTNSSNIPMVSATSLFAPMHQSNLLLRTIGLGYLSLPTFTLVGGVLHTIASDGFGQGNYSYGSAAPVIETELQFLQNQNADAGFGLTGGFLLGVGGVTDGWRLCAGALEQTVVKWKGTDASCTPTYIQAVAAPPY